MFCLWSSRSDIPCMVRLLSALFVFWLCLFLPSAEIVPYEGAWHSTGFYLSVWWATNVSVARTSRVWRVGRGLDGYGMHEYM
jgi:hypothetical protein